MTIYKRVHRSTGNFLVRWEGMTLSQVETMLQADGLVYDTLAQSDWDAIIPPATALYVFAGQSNDLYMYQKQGPAIVAAMGDAAAVAVANPVGGSPMSRWASPSGDLFLQMMQNIRDAKAANHAAYVAGLLFWQGESDTDPSLEALWQTRFTNMVAAVRSEFNPKMPVVFAQITNTGGADRDAFRAMQAAISISRVTMVSTAGITIGGNDADGTPGLDHTDNAGYATMATRFVAALKALQ